MTKILIAFPWTSRARLSCKWIETGNPKAPLACVWVDRVTGATSAVPVAEATQCAEAGRPRLLSGDLCA
jgi:hypothetical protein